MENNIALYVPAGEWDVGRDTSHVLSLCANANMHCIKYEACKKLSKVHTVNQDWRYCLRRSGFFSLWSFKNSSTRMEKGALPMFRGGCMTCSFGISSWVAGGISFSIKSRAKVSAVKWSWHKITPPFGTDAHRISDPTSNLWNQCFISCCQPMYSPLRRQHASWLPHAYPASENKGPQNDRPLEDW